MENKKMRTAKIVATVLIILFVIGLCLAGALLMKRTETETIGSRLKNGFPLYFFGAFAAVGLINIVKGILRVAYRIKHCRYVTEAMCVEHDCKYSSDNDGGGSWVYSPVYEFEYNGRNYRVRNYMYASKFLIADVCSTATIHVDMDELDDYYIGTPFQGLIVSFIVGLVFATPALFILIGVLLQGLNLI